MAFRGTRQTSALRGTAGTLLDYASESRRVSATHWRAGVRRTCLYASKSLESPAPACRSRGGPDGVTFGFRVSLSSQLPQHGHGPGHRDQRTFAWIVLLILSLRPFPWPQRKELYI